MTDDEKHWLAADYVLGVMRGEEKNAFERSMRSDPALAKSVLAWQERLSMVDHATPSFTPTLSDQQVDDMLEKVFSKVCAAIDAQPDSALKLTNPLAKLTREQVASMRPAVVRLIASYLVLLERLKSQQLKLVAASGRA